MANVFSYSIGRKLIMSLSGLFLIMFLFVHLTINSLLLLDPIFGTQEGEMFNAGVHFMSINPAIKIIEPILFVGFIIHILYSIVLTFQNMRARGSSVYSSGNKTKDVEWTSKNMFILGIALVAFLVIHLIQFWVKMKFTGDPLLADTTFSYFGVQTTGHNAYALVHETFQHLWVMIAYIIGGIALALHMSHGLWSAFHTVGFSNNIWLTRLQTLSTVIAWIIGLGFCTIAIVQFAFYPLS
ncbi:MAG: succinate dehydrogenase cytochrome b subunit [Bacteroidales bacterium]